MLMKSLLALPRRSKTLFFLQVVIYFRRERENWKGKEGEEERKDSWQQPDLLTLTMPQNVLRAYCARKGIALTAYSPLGSPARPPRWVKGDNPIPLELPAVLEAAAATGRSAAQVLLRWQLQRGVAVIPKSVTPARIAENLAAGAGEGLPEAVMAALEGAEVPEGKGRILTGYPAPGQTWEELWE